MLDCRLGVFSATCWCRAASPTRPAAVAAVLPALPAPPPHPSHHRRADFPASGTLLCTLARGPPRPPMARPAELRGRRGGRGHQAGTRPRSLTQPLPFLMRNGCALRSAHQGFLQRWAAPAVGGAGRRAVPRAGRGRADGWRCSTTTLSAGAKSPRATGPRSAPAPPRAATHPPVSPTSPVRPSSAPTTDGGARARRGVSPGLLRFRAAPGLYKPSLTPRCSLGTQVLPETAEAFRVLLRDSRVPPAAGGFGVATHPVHNR